MNHQFPEILSELNRKRIQAEMAAIRLEEEAAKGKSISSRTLATLGEWMVRKGEKLRARYEASSEAAAGSVLRSQARKVGA